MPATAAIDNETLDHLLSVVDDGNQYRGGRIDSKASWNQFTSGPLPASPPLIPIKATGTGAPYQGE
jgi:hypothetical protein